MKSRPILFSTAMVRANLAGTKSQTRRIFRIQKDSCGDPIMQGDPRLKSPYGNPGDQLWVREEHYLFGHWQPIPGKLTKSGKQKWAFIPADDTILFEAPESFRKGRHSKDSATPAWHKRLARFMPRKHSRLTLEITSIRVERLQDISEEDAIAEGVKCRCMSSAITVTPKVAYAELWESINGPGSWNENPCVWVISFKNLK